MSSSSGPEVDQTEARRGVRPAVVLAVGLLAAALALVAPIGSPAASAATGSCRSVSGAPAATGGPERATVVVDTGSGAVWSACISFSGTISGIDALELARAQIPGLAPVYDVYVGQGRAVCRLRGVGNDPPDCLGKTVEYWGYFRNGRYSSAGAGGVTVRDGDVEGWRWGTSGATPRRATQGYEAAAPVAPVTVAPTTPPTAPPTSAAPQPSVGSPVPQPTPGGGSAPRQAPSGSPATTSTSPTAPTTSRAGAADASTTTAADSPSSTAASGAEPEVSGDADAPDGSASATPGTPGGPSLDEGDGGSSAGSVAAFAGALAAIGGAGLVLRRRRSAATEPPIAGRS